MMKNHLKKYMILTVLFCAVISIGYSQNKTEEQHNKVVMRMVGHEFLLQLGDSSSRVLPVEKIEGRYKIQFEREFGLEPDLITMAAFNVFEKHNFKQDYIVEIENCETKEVVYSYEVNIANQDNIIPCKSRPLPESCYQIYFTIMQPTTTTDIEEKDVDSPNQAIFYALGLLLIVLLVIFFFVKKKKQTDLDPDVVTIGEYQFNKTNMTLTYNKEVEDLSSKEADLLELLFTHKNETIEREQILHVVWNDEGDYIGRTLDVSISKLRKRLQNDPNLKITNIRGVGYRFIVGE